MPSKGCRYLTSGYAEPQVGTTSLLPYKHPLVPSLHRGYTLEHREAVRRLLDTLAVRAL